MLHFINPDGFDSLDDFIEQYGDMKSKERVDELHETIRPYILRRLKEDVEKSVPPKEETLIEVELTTLQKQYYRALYEKNLKFLHKNKKKHIDGPSINVSEYFVKLCKFASRSLIHICCSLNTYIELGHATEKMLQSSFLTERC